MSDEKPPPIDEERAGMGGSPKKQSSFAIDAIGMTISRIFLRLTGFISNIIIARVLGPEGRGLISALTVPSQLAINFSELGIRQSTAFHLGRGLLTTKQLVPTLLGMVPIAGGIGIGAALLYFEFAGIADQDWTARALAVAIIPIGLVSAYSTGVFLGEQRIAEYRKANWRPAVASLAVLSLLAALGLLDPRGALIAPLAGALVAASYALYLLRRSAPLRIGFDRSVARMLQTKAFSYAASLMILMLNYRIMILMLSRYSTLDQVGLFAQAILIAELIWEIPNSLSAIVLSRAVNAKDEQAFSIKVQVLARISFFVAVLISIGLGIIAPWFFPFVFGPDFAGSGIVCIALLPGIAAFILFKILNIDLAGRGKPWLSMTVMLPILALNIGAGWWAIQRADALGAALVSSLCYMVAAVGYLGVYARVTGFSVFEVMRYRRSDFDMLMRALPLQKLRRNRK
ncbi:lipopolysaccharide biosynthesis protein [Sphingomonas sp. 37zxx]|uniref:lipopolysaccharide biosynthesis protein n=1 Tax=Sphingomonas sp. 37zxx TaxID=1550073 RepID=UPI00053BF5FD|nr:oligosaccharide flippase family protein [Sphingomonas sp. 37zxx]